jgi:hypothetical protein
MEDRQDAGLWLERDASPDRAEALRASGLRVTEFVSARDYGDQLPRRLDDFDRLLVAELPSLEAMPAAADNAWGFRRYPRPSQGICTGQPTTGILLVLISPKTPEQAQALRDWGDFVHLRHIAAAAVPGYTTMTPYECVTAERPRFMHFYEMDNDDPVAAYEAMTPLVAERLGGGPGTPAYDDWAWHPALRIEFVKPFRRAAHTS